jgi:hypothetical protein
MAAAIADAVVGAGLARPRARAESAAIIDIDTRIIKVILIPNPI